VFLVARPGQIFVPGNRKKTFFALSLASPVAEIIIIRLNNERNRWGD